MKKKKQSTSLVAKILEEFEPEQLNKNLDRNILELLPVKGDINLLRQVFINQVSNPHAHIVQRNSLLPASCSTIRRRN